MTSKDAALTLADRVAWLRLIRSENVGPATFRDLVTHFGSPAAALEALPGLARHSGRSARIATADEAERELDAIDKMGARTVTLGEPDYPVWLRTVDAAPPLVTVRGDARVLARPAVAVVGSRNASISGRKFAMQIAGGLGEAGFVIVSGLARGIDAAAHTAALGTGTVAVFAGGLDRPYPPENIALGDDIVARGGAHVTEMPMGWEPRARDFPRRNRLISGLTVAVVVVEAALRSGSLITARLAGEQGRLVFAVPGSPLDPRSGGANQLIRDGATIVTSVADIISEIQPMLAREPEQQTIARPAPADGVVDADQPDRDRIVEAIGSAPVDLDDIIRHTGLSAAIVRLVVLELDLEGRLERHTDGRVSLV